MMILFVDDEKRIMDSYKDYLEIKLGEIDKKLYYFSKVDEADKFYKDNISEIELVVLDVMMPGGNVFDFKKSNGGFKTGFLFYQEIRKKLPDLPVILFTNIVDSEIKAEVDQDKYAMFLQKKDYLLTEFWEKIKNYLD